MPKSLPPIHESHEELLRLFNALPDRERRNRVHAVFLVKMGACHTRKAVAAALNVERKAVERWLIRDECEGLQSLMISQRSHCGHTPRIQGNALSELTAQLHRPEGFHGYQSLCTWLKDPYGIDVPYNTVSGKLKATPKVARKSNVKKDPLHEETFKKRIRGTPARGPTGQLPALAGDGVRPG